MRRACWGRPWCSRWAAPCSSRPPRRWSPRECGGDAGAASGLMNSSKQFGGALGLAALSAVAGPDGTGYGRVFVTMTGVLGVIALLALALPRARPAPDPDG